MRIAQILLFKIQIRKFWDFLAKLIIELKLLSKLKIIFKFRTLFKNLKSIK